MHIRVVFLVTFCEKNRQFIQGRLQRAIAGNLVAFFGNAN